MLLAIDIGNSEICIGGISGSEVFFCEELSTDRSRTDLEYAISFKNILGLNGHRAEELEGAIISSVVPQMNQTIYRAVEKAFQIHRILTVGPGVKTGLNIRIDDPAKLGSDLVVNAVAAVKEYPLPAIVIDMSTCTTFSAINGNGAYIGGIIAPGVQLSIDAMIRNTAQLPQVSLEDPGHAIGRNTYDCIKSGVLYGNAAMIDGMIDRIARELGTPASIIATGRIARLIIPQCSHPIFYDEALLLKGLQAIYRKNT